METNTRAEALQWWRGLTESQKVKMVKRFGGKTSSGFSFGMITSSTHAIERIFLMKNKKKK